MTVVTAGGMTYRGNVLGFLVSFVKNAELRLSLSYKIILEQREERDQLNS